jgi:hypothetical protein
MVLKLGHNHVYILSSSLFSNHPFSSIQSVLPTEPLNHKRAITDEGRRHWKCILRVPVNLGADISSEISILFTSHKSKTLKCGEYGTLIMLKNCITLALFTVHILPLRIVTKYVGGSGTASDFYSGGAQFKSQYFTLGHGRFLPQPFQFITLCRPVILTLCSLELLTASLNKLQLKN